MLGNVPCLFSKNDFVPTHILIIGKWDLGKIHIPNRLGPATRPAENVKTKDVTASKMPLPFSGIGYGSLRQRVNLGLPLERDRGPSIVNNRHNIQEQLLLYLEKVIRVTCKNVCENV